MKYLTGRKIARSRPSGFTVFEVMLYVALMAGVLYAGFLLYVAAISNEVRQKARLEVENSSTFALLFILQKIRNADSVISPANESSENSLVLDIDGVQTSISVVDGILTIEEGAAEAIQLSSPDVQIDDLLFINKAVVGTPGSIHVEFVAGYVDAAYRAETDFERTYVGSASIRSFSL